MKPEITPSPRSSLLEHGCERLRSLARAAGFAAEEQTVMTALFAELLGPWGEWPCGGDAPWPSDVSDDHTPYELSIVAGGRKPELRLLVERRDQPATLASNRAAGLQLTLALAHRFGLSLERFDRVADLLLPSAGVGLFALWHAVSFWPGEQPAFKLYFNLHARGAERATALAEEALARLGFAAAWPAIVERALRRGPRLDVPMYLSLDLDRRDDARVKLYFRHVAASADDLEAACAATPGYVPGKITALCHAITDSSGPFPHKGPVTCFALTSADPRTPRSSTFYFPVAAYALDDLSAHDRIATFLARAEVSPQPYRAALAAHARRPLDAGVGMQSYVSLRPTREPPRITVYLSPEAFTVTPPRRAQLAPPPPAPPSVDELVAQHERQAVTDHPFFARLGREPVDLRRLWRLMSSFHEGIVQHFPRRLAALVARVGDDRLRSILAKQLNDELGDGQYDRAHRLLFGRLMRGLAPWAPPGGVAVGPARELGAALEYAYTRAPVHEAIGASIVVEIYGKQVDTRIGAEFRRQEELTGAPLEWLHLHETLEVDHADESLVLGRLLPDDDDARAAAARGAELIADAAWRFFDQLYAQCFA